MKASLPPAWVDKIGDIDEYIAKIQSKCKSCCLYESYLIFEWLAYLYLIEFSVIYVAKELTALHTKRLMINFDSDEAAQEREIERVTQDITSDFRSAEKLLKQFSKIGDEGSASAAELRVRDNLQKSVAKRLQSLSMAFRATQNEYLNRLREQKRLGAGNQAFDFLNSGAPAGRQAVPQEVDNGFTTAQMQVVEDTEAVSIHV